MYVRIYWGKTAQIPELEIEFKSSILVYHTL